ncbi:protein kinase domain-containing protein [Lihuaxuella thermophila]|uniref:Serine/threonine-protein kinase PrkC n=1 Tax=Lihuaxuella thermophila TaxID=1173111 RepID=A0A1H8J9N1_9BACL|nr:protein kinase [Lihuaxuella thermophila]SEN77500.1 Serine/threonine protein kinase [Lihuaxuella thermophila]
MGGRYQIIQHVGGGGMAKVYKAKDTILDRFVAIKVMNEILSHDRDFVRRFIQEAQATAKLSHPNIMNVYDAGREGQTYFMVMEYVDGPTLKKWIRSRGALSPKEAISIAMQICDGLAHAHANGIVHRDIKPQNIMSAPDGRIKVTDFGISRILRSSSTLTKTGTVMGSVHYFSPEQARGSDIGFPSDLYSLGVVLFEMVTGRVPFDGEENINVALKHVQEPVPDPRSFNPDLPDECCRVIFKALEKDPGRRYQSAEEMKRALQQAMSSIRKSTIHTHADVQLSKKADHPAPGVEQSSRQLPSRNDRLRHTTLQPMKSKRTAKMVKRFIFIGFAIILLLSALKLAGEIQTSVSAKPPANQKTESPRGPDPGTRTKMYKIIVGTFANKQNAEKLKSRLQAKGVTVFVDQVQIAGKTRYRVQAGAFRNREMAEEQLKKLQRNGFEHAHIVN